MTNDQTDTRVVEAAPGTAPICPHCGGGMARKEASSNTLECGGCGEVQHIERLSAEALKRQESHLGVRRIDRLLTVIKGWSERP